MCECLTDIPRKFKEKYADGWKGKQIHSANFPCGLNFSTGKTIYNLNLIVEAVGQKKVIEVPVIMKYCPFCGDSLDANKSLDEDAQKAGHPSA